MKHGDGTVREALKQEGAVALRPKWERFCVALVDGASKAQAYLDAGYKPKSRQTASTCGFTLAKKPEIQARLRYLEQQYQVAVARSRDEVVKEIERLAFADIRDVVSWDKDGIEVRPSDAISPEAASSLQSVEMVDSKQGRRVTVKQYSKLEALKELATIQGMREEKEEHGPAVVVVVPEKLSAADWMDRYAPKPPGLEGKQEVQVVEPQEDT